MGHPPQLSCILLESFSVSTRKRTTYADVVFGSDDTKCEKVTYDVVLDLLYLLKTVVKKQLLVQGLFSNSKYLSRTTRQETDLSWDEFPTSARITAT